MKRCSLLLALALIGCSQKPPALPSTHAVKGTIKTQTGSPLTGGRLVLVPKKAGADVFGDIDQNGNFNLGTFKPGDGAVSGKYTVTISPYNYRGRSGSPEKLRLPVQQKYYDAASSGHEVEISDTDSTLNIQLK